MENINSVQETINKKAYAQCHAVVLEFCNHIRHNPKLRNAINDVITVIVPTKDGGEEKKSLYQAFGDTSYTLPQQLIDYIMPAEIQKQTEEFFQRINRLETQVKNVESKLNSK